MKTANNMRSRLRFDSIEHSTTPNGSVRLEWRGEYYEETIPCCKAEEVLPGATVKAVLNASKRVMDRGHLASTQSSFIATPHSGSYWNEEHR
jgi:hypothetical protein